MRGRTGACQARATGGNKFRERGQQVLKKNWGRKEGRGEDGRKKEGRREIRERRKRG